MRAPTVFVVAFILVLSGCVQFTGPDGESLPLGRDSGGWYVEQLVDSVEEWTYLSAKVKGSIYETGETVSVFGTCLNGDDEPVPTAVAFLSAWYPNGTLFINETNMTEIETGYFLFTGPMNAVQGTYLTEMRCLDTDSGAEALAFGEWQNPFWVKRIGNIDANVSNITQQVANITISIGEFRVNVTDSFEITWDRQDQLNATINSSFENLSGQIYVVGQIANDSVDRNNSYLADLLEDIWSGTNPGPTGEPLYWTEDADNVIYASDWSITVKAFVNITDEAVQFPDVQCLINTTQTPTQQSMTPKGVNFEYEEYIFIRGGNEFNWDVECVWL